MGRYLVRRVLMLFVVLFAVSFITFALMNAVPGGPFDREKALPEDIMRNLEKKYHLDDPFLKRYADYMIDVMVPSISTVAPNKGDLQDDTMITIKLGPSLWFRWMNFGPSFASRSRTVTDIFRQQLPVSIQLGIYALIIALIIGVPLGILGALRHNTIWDYLGMGVAIFGVSVPVIVLGPIMIWIFGISLGWLPPTGWGSKPPYILGIFPTNLSWSYWRYAIMPSVALGLGSSAIIARLTRASLLQVIREDYIRTARAKGLGERMVIYGHALKNSLIPVVTVLGPIAAALVTGTFVTELTFGIPGMGKYFVTSITNRDYPVIMGTILLYALFLVVANLIVDLTYAYLDPRIRYE